MAFFAISAASLVASRGPSAAIQARVVAWAIVRLCLPLHTLEKILKMPSAGASQRLVTLSLGASFEFKTNYLSTTEECRTELKGSSLHLQTLLSSDSLVSSLR